MPSICETALFIMRQPGRRASAPVVLEAQSASGAVDISMIRQRMMTRYAFRNIRTVLVGQNMATGILNFNVHTS